MISVIIVIGSPRQHEGPLMVDDTLKCIMSQNPCSEELY